ncbi:hypothetical protein BGLCM_0112 [Bifidobacterium gallicum DSM 20093 = LMG 11596]|uniref:Uncharacterized protein n=1 Tax=Bifidobacterium gallicum DSM 20093 = LMG 11596 TaxID=561180 RepID=A0A087AMU2_9BIFI|nr:hypothetical protein BGLCM_0112 [Bifidobacterium gallicum DSM 20093 = LMG 11596]
MVNPVDSYWHNAPKDSVEYNGPTPQLERDAQRELLSDMAAGLINRDWEACSGHERDHTTPWNTWSL